MTNDDFREFFDRDRENRRVVMNVGVLQSALREIKAHVAVNGEGLMSRAVIASLEENINK